MECLTEIQRLDLKLLLACIQFDPFKELFHKGTQGTGPFKVTEFRTNDTISFAVNPEYRDADKPAVFKQVKGGKFAFLSTVKP